MMDTCVLIPEEFSLVLTLHPNPKNILEMNVALWSNTTLPVGARFTPDDGAARLDKLEVYSHLPEDDVSKFIYLFTYYLFIYLFIYSTPYVNSVKNQQLVERKPVYVWRFRRSPTQTSLCGYRSLKFRIWYYNTRLQRKIKTL